MAKEIGNPVTFDEVFLWIRNNKQLEESDRISGVTQLLGTIDCIDTLRWIAASGLVGLELLDSIEINYPNHLLNIKRAIALKLETEAQDTLSKRGLEAVNIRHDRIGGSRDLKRQILAIWNTGKYSTKALCAEEEYQALGYKTYDTARKALKESKS